MTRKNKHRGAALLAILPGLLTLWEGGSVLLGLETRSYTVLPWLVWFNVILGFAAIIVGIGLWRERAESVRPATTILTLHGLVLMILVILFAFRQPVAVVSIMAMLFRTGLWIAIVLLLKEKAVNRP
jgi:hypothetical protein